MAGVESTPEIQEQRERESRLVLSELGTMIGLKNARQYSPEFTLSKVSAERSSSNTLTYADLPVWEALWRDLVRLTCANLPHVLK